MIYWSFLHHRRRFYQASFSFERFFNQHYAANQKFVVPFMIKITEFYVQELNNAVIAVSVVFITCAYQIFRALQPGYIATISSYFVSLWLYYASWNGLSEHYGKS